MGVGVGMRARGAARQVCYAGDGVRVLRFETLRRDWAAWSREVLGREVPLPCSNSSGTGSGHYSDAFAGDQVGGWWRGGIVMDIAPKP